MKPDTESIGLWTGYIEQGATVEDRRARLAECPAAIVDKVKIQVAGAFQASNNKRRYGRG